MNDFLSKLGITDYQKQLAQFKSYFTVTAIAQLVIAVGALFTILNFFRKK